MARYNLAIALFLKTAILVSSSSDHPSDGLSLISFIHFHRLQQLTKNYIKISDALTAKEAQLETLTENYDKITDVLAGKDARLEELESTVIGLKIKVNRLEETVQQQRLEKESKFIPSHLALNDQRPMGKAVSFPRTCRELRAVDPTLSSGLHWIDPDGQGVGDDPIQVYCDMTKGSTSILHDTELAIDVGHCADPGCYSRPVNYNSTMRQMIALADLSAECHQSIQYDCNFAPFEIGGIAYAWWNDRNGAARYFWAGANTSVHTCQCGIDKNCADPSMTCNCDSAAPVPLRDSGVISDKKILPIARLNFGRTQLASSSGIHTLGRLECSGQVSVTGMPKSCVELWQIGHSLSGLHSVMGADQVETVYCDFSKLPSDSGFQKWIGFNDVKSQPVYFYVQRNTDGFNITGTSIPFELERLNIGNAMNLTSGIFTAPRSGTYYFTFNGLAYFSGSSSIILFQVGIYLNGNSIGSGRADEVSTILQADSISLHSTLNLKTGDRIWLQINTLYTGTYLHESGSHHTHFSGWLIEENFSQLL